jgi:DNA invertase Pin-like site-specific DNA recombinase
MKRAVIYARVSKDREESVSIEAQIEHCTARALQLGAAVVKVFQDEGISGREARNRAAFQRAKAFCEAANVEYFITWSTSRFARNMMELFISEAELRGVGTTLECLNADIDDETDTGLVNKAINGLMDELYSRQVARDTLRSQKKSAARASSPAAYVPFGYRRVKDGARSRLEVCPVDGPIAARVFELAGEGLGAQAIALKMNEAGPAARRQALDEEHRELHAQERDVHRRAHVQQDASPRAQGEAAVRVDPGGQPSGPRRSRNVRKDPGHARGTHTASRARRHAAQHVPLHRAWPRAEFAAADCKCTGKGRAGTLYSYYACVAHRRGAPRCLLRQVRADLFDDWLLGRSWST